ncbi:hypothetical protein [Streptomyces sp. NPDC005795]|uniref:hypothetical protein n=1 Tax=Streptomyces sp. NPDC005795 TaxID=3154677 RepID=UPI0034067DF3
MTSTTGSPPGTALRPAKLVSTDSSSYTLPLALRTLRIDPAVTPGVVMAASLLALLPSVIVFLFFQRSFVSGLSSGALKG